MTVKQPETVLSSGERRPGVRLNASQRTGQLPATEKDLAPNVGSAKAGIPGCLPSPQPRTQQLGPCSSAPRPRKQAGTVLGFYQFYF